MEKGEEKQRRRKKNCCQQAHSTRLKQQHATQFDSNRRDETIGAIYHTLISLKALQRPSCILIILHLGPSFKRTE